MGKNIKKLAERYKVKRNLKYLSIDSAQQVIRVRVPDASCVTFNLKTFDGGLKGMLVQAIITRDNILKAKTKKSSIKLFSAPIKTLNAKYGIRQSSNSIYTDTPVTDEVDSIYVRGMVDGGFLVYKIPLKDFEGLDNSPYYHAHYYAVFIRNNAFRQDRPPNSKIEKAAREWACDVKKHGYQKLDIIEFSKAVQEFKEKN